MSAAEYRVCDHCTRTTGGASMSVLRARGWRMFDGESMTGKRLRKIVCPYCAGTATEPEPIGWRVGCDTCYWEYEADDGDGPLNEKDAQQVADDHECEPDTWIKAPERRAKPEVVETGVLV